jgi:hypothetical protein
MADKIAESAQQACRAARRAGRLIPPTACQTCDATHEHYRPTRPIKLVGHHWAGYAYPLTVWWICYRCNSRLRGRHDGSFTLAEAGEHVRQERWDPEIIAARRRAEYEQRYSAAMAKAIESAKKFLDEYELVDPETAEPGTFEVTCGIAYRKRLQAA